MYLLFILIVCGLQFHLVFSEVLKTITITENDMSIQVLANLTEILANITNFPHSVLSKIEIVPLSENDLAPFKLQSNQLIQPNNGVDREAICRVKPNDIQRKFCKADLCCKFIGFQYLIMTDPNSFFILIQILDQNDKAPQFSSIKRPFFRIPENVDVGYVIDLPMAVDSDSEKYSVRRYSISHVYHLDKTQDFRLHVTYDIPPRPQLIVNSKLDYEKINKYVFRLFAYDFDEKSIGNSCSTTIEIEIEDLNDNVPKFNQLTYNANIDENKRDDKLIKFTVSDPDSGRNGIVSVSIVDKVDELSKRFKIFEIQRNEFYLELINSLDYETDPHLFEFTLLATDQGTPSLSSTAQVKIHLKNLNDNGPKIYFKKLGSSVSNSVSIVEGLLAHSLVVEVRVADADTNLNMIHCKLVDYNDLFYLDNPSKFNSFLNYKPFHLKTINKIDRESNHGSFLRVTISCTDSEPNRQITTNESLNIQIEDVNDNTPMFSQQVYVGNVDENQINIAVSFPKPIVVTDRDSGLNGKSEFFLEDFQNLSDISDFLIDKISGKIFTQRSLDYETKNKFRFKIIAVDKGNQPLTSSSTITVNVLDLNDNAPKFSESHYIFNVFENVTVGWKIGTLQATDDDTDRKNKDIFYSIETKGDNSNYFDIDRYSGELRTRKPLDRETLESISIKVTAKNPNKYSNQFVRNTDSEVDVMIKVLDVNDNAPKFIPRSNMKQKVEFFVEQFVDGNTCTELPYTVQDVDDGGNSGQNCCYTILENDYNKLFSLMTDTPSYICLQRKPEKYQSYTVTLIARDRPPNVEGGLTSKVSFPVLIVNDPHSKVSTSGFSNHPDSRFPNPNESKNLIIIGILTTVVLVVIIIIIIIIIIIKRCSIPEQECDNTKCYQGLTLSMNRNEGTKVNYLVSESGLSPGKATISRSNLTNPQYADSISKTLTRNLPSNVSSPFTPPAYHQIIANQGVRIIHNPNRFHDQYTYEWSPVPDFRDQSMARNPNSVEKIRSMSPTKSGLSFHTSSKMLNEDQLDSGYQILNPFGLSSSPQQHFNNYSPENLVSGENEICPIDTRSLTLLNNFFDENNNGANSKTTPRTMKKNYFQTTFV